MISQDFSSAGWGRENLGNKITGDCLQHVPGHSLPCFSGSPAPAYWGGSFMCELFTEVGFAVATTPAPESGIKTLSHKDLVLGLGLFSQLYLSKFLWELSRLDTLQGAAEIPVFPPSLGLLQLAEHNWERNRLTYLLLLIANSFICFTFSPPFPFIFLNDCRKYSSQFQHLPSWLGGEKDASPGQENFDLETQHEWAPSSQTLLQQRGAALTFLGQEPVGWWQNLARRTDYLLNVSFHISPCCIQIIWPFYLLEPSFFSLKGDVVMLPAESHGAKLLWDGSWWVCAGRGRARGSWCRAVPHDDLPARPFDTVSGAVLCLPCRRKCRNSFVTFPYAKTTQGRKGFFSPSGKLPFPFDLLYASPFPLWKKNCQHFFLENLNAV